MKLVALAIPLLFSLAACGANPATVAKERDRSDERRRAAEADNTALTKKNSDYQTALNNVTATTTAVWTIYAVTGRHADAMLLCKEIGFTLPTTAELDEFKTEIYDQKAAWQQLSFNRFFASDVVQDQSDNVGIALCRRDAAQNALTP